jgi:hypothetical protein
LTANCKTHCTFVVSWACFPGGSWGHVRVRQLSIHFPRELYSVPQGDEWSTRKWVRPRHSSSSRWTTHTAGNAKKTAKTAHYCLVVLSASSLYSKLAGGTRGLRAKRFIVTKRLPVNVEGLGWVVNAVSFLVVACGPMYLTKNGLNIREMQF